MSIPYGDAEGGVQEKSHEQGGMLVLGRRRMLSPTATHHFRARSTGSVLTLFQMIVFYEAMAQFALMSCS